MGRTIKEANELKLNLWQTWTISLGFTDRLAGGVPKSPDLIEGWIRSRIKDESRVGELIERTKEEMGLQAATEAQIEEIKERSWIGFKSDDQGLYIEGRQVKAMFKEAANILKNKFDLNAFKARLAERFFVPERRIYLGVTEPSGSYESTMHVMTAQGPRTAMKRVDYVQEVIITFTLKVLDEPFITKSKDKIYPAAIIPILLEYAGQNGLGADRSQGLGCFEVLELKEVD